MSSIIYVQRPAALFIWRPLTSIMQDWITSTLDSFSVQHCFSIMESDWCDYMFINAQAFNIKNTIYYEIIDLEVVTFFHSLVCFGRITTCTFIQEEKVQYLIGISVQIPSVCCTGGSQALRGLHRCGTEGVWKYQASSLSPGKRREQEASDQSGCSREPLCRWKVNHHCSTKLSFMTDGGVSSAKGRQRPGLKLLALILTSCLEYLC